MIRGLLLIVGAVVVLLFGAAVGYLAREVMEAKQSITSLCRDIKSGEPLATFVTRARDRGVRVDMGKVAEDGSGVATAWAGLLSEKWACDATHVGGRVTGVKLRRGD